MAFARSEKTGQRFYSMSAQIRQEHEGYYDTLEWTQKGELDVKRWQDWFLNCLQRAIEGAQETLGAVLDKARFWGLFAKEPLNERQITIIRYLPRQNAAGTLSECLGDKSGQSTASGLISRIFCTSSGR